MSASLVVRISRAWDEPAQQTAEFRPARSAAALLTWTTSPPAIDAGVPGPIADVVSQVVASLGGVAFRLFFPEELPTGLHRLPMKRPWWPIRIYQRLTRTWSADIAIATEAAGAAELFQQDWQLQGQTALVLRAGALTSETLQYLQRLRDWRGTSFPADACLLIAPAVDGDGILFVAESASDLAAALSRLRQAFERACIPVNDDTPVHHNMPAMEVTISHHIDASEPDANSDYDYYYEYDIYRFSRAGRTYVARSYRDEPDGAAFQSCLEGEEWSLLGPADLIDSLLVQAVDYLQRAGKTKLDRLTETEGYVPLEVMAAADLG